LEIGHLGIFVSLGGGQVVDTESAREFMREALTRIGPEELEAVASELEEKARRFRARLANSPDPLDDAALRPILRSIFAVRRKTDELVQALGEGRMGRLARDLIRGEGPLPERFEAFSGAMGPLPEVNRFDLASELLHYTDPERYWLWTRWMWDPAARTGALPLVTMAEVNLDGGGLGQSYLRVGESVAFVRSTGEAAGFARIGRGPHGVYVYLACVYAVYVYTTLRIRMTQEFNKVVPQLPELIRRLLGTRGMEV
jgi:hypothetical protein